MIKKSIMLAVAALSFGGFFALSQAPATNAASSTNMPGALTYHKTKMNAKIGSNYKKFQLTNHAKNSNFKNIKTISWKKAGLKKGSKVTIDLYATQGTQYNWYRISKYTTKKTAKKAKVQKYWVYGQALVLPKSTSNIVSLAY
ncbi:hypothetical protein LASUN_11140 [Lentilactobacillus sunkii]|jgi:predicted porin|uniref:Uncharacterized protein n=1 Tax=Lentilactobacillus sunkii TaxID=481719 RepID=A0A1E7XD56_9LACO|nr:hypothetical protein [Lentilactobacillus sunkii]OFA11045.1 hypothetical protein LASUN_11140 [Lentilactobacillus sunkii]